MVECKYGFVCWAINQHKVNITVFNQLLLSITAPVQIIKRFMTVRQLCFLHYMKNERELR